MKSKLFSRYVQIVPVLLVAVLLAHLLNVTTAYAKTQSLALQKQAAGCQIRVPTGWRPYRVQPTDTLEALVMRANVGLETVVQANCLTTTLIEADTLLLLPALPAAKAAVTTVQNGLQNTPVVTNQSLITVISTTATTAAAPVAAQVESSATTAVLSSITSPLTTANAIAMAVFALAGVGIFFFTLRPRPDDSAALRSLFTTVGNAIFLGAGILIGIVLFPMVNFAALAALPTGLSATIAVALIGLLVAKELFFTGRQWYTVNRLLNLGIAPLLMIFFLTVATRVVESIN